MLRQIHPPHPDEADATDRRPVIQSHRCERGSFYAKIAGRITVKEER